MSPGERSLFRKIGNMLLILVSLLFSTLVAGDCSADNCLRALRSSHVTGGVDSPQAFCAISASGSISATAIPESVAAACKNNQNGSLSSRIASACGCIARAAATSSASKAAATSSASVQSTTLRLTANPSVTSIASNVSYTTTPSPTTTQACALVSSAWAIQSSLGAAQSASWSSQAAAWTAATPITPIRLYSLHDTH